MDDLVVDPPLVRYLAVRPSLPHLLLPLFQKLPELASVEFRRDGQIVLVLPSGTSNTSAVQTEAVLVDHTLSPALRLDCAHHHLGALLRDQPGIDVFVSFRPDYIDGRLPSVQIENAPLNVELSPEQRHAAPSVLRDTAFSIHVGAHGVSEAVARASPDIPVAGSTHNVQCAGAEKTS